MKAKEEKKERGNQTNVKRECRKQFPPPCVKSGTKQNYKDGVEVSNRLVSKLNAM